jgi:hypothetical protein
MNSDFESEEVPADFPRQEILGAVGGAAPKLLLVRAPGGKFVAPTISDEERVVRWRYCEYFVQHLVDASLRCKSGKRAHMSELAILEQYDSRLRALGWTSDDEAKWIFRRVGALLGWPVPESCK